MVLKTFYNQAIYHPCKLLQPILGPVILLISNDDGSHCLIVTLTSVHHIVLSVLSVAKLHNLVYLIQAGALQSKIWHSLESIQNFSHNTGTFPHQETQKHYVPLTRGYGGSTCHQAISIAPIAPISTCSVDAGLGGCLSPLMSMVFAMG